MDLINSPVDPNERIYQDTASTAATTPDGCSVFSPVLDGEQQTDSLDHASLDLQSSSSRFADRFGNDASSSLLETPGCVRNICCIGAGYVGGPTAAVIAYHNPHIRVTVVDRDAERIRKWNSRHLPIYESGLRHVVRIARDGGRAFTFVNAAGGLHSDTSGSAASSECCGLARCHAPMDEAAATVSARRPNLFFSVEVQKCVADADLIFIAVNTPAKSSGVGAGSATDMSAFEAAACDLVKYARPGAIIVEKSTIPCRTAEVVRDIAAVYRPDVYFDILSNPEFLAAGTAVHGLMQPDRILIGSFRTPSGRCAADALAEVYAAWVPRTRIIMTNVWSSELSKLVANAMLAQRISSINSISAICEETGAEIDEVAISIGSDPRIGNRFLKAGVGFGGSCFRKDIMSLVYLADSLGLGDVGEYWRQVVKMNEYQRDRFSRRVIRCLNNTLAGKKITFLGYAFKANTSDTRDSPTLDIIKMLLEERPAEIAIFDPYCNPTSIRREMETLLAGRDGVVVVYSNVYEACMASHAVLVTTECEEFRNAGSRILPLPDVCKPDSPLDPRPFAQRQLSEMDILALHKFLVWPSPISAHKESDPLRRFEEEPRCVEDCPGCSIVKTSRDIVDWHRISYHMKMPKWLFDGKGIIDAQEMTKLGLRVESIGRRGKRWDG